MITRTEATLTIGKIHLVHVEFSFSLFTLIRTFLYLSGGYLTTSSSMGTHDFPSGLSSKPISFACAKVFFTEDLVIGPFLTQE